MELKYILVAVDRFKHHFRSAPIKVPLRIERGKAA
jgi:hypothetical protein